MPRKRLEPPKYSRDGTIGDNALESLRMELRDAAKKAGGPVVEADARAALKTIHAALEGSMSLTRAQLRYLRKALGLFVGGVTGDLNQAFGLRAFRRGQTAIPEARQIQIATEVLRELLKGKNLDEAAERAGHRCKIGTTQARRYWAHHKTSACRTIRLERPLGAYPWTDAEAKRLERIFAKSNRAVAELLEADAGK